MLQRALATDEAELRVVNTGVSGLRVANHLATLRVISDLQPALVLFLLGANDWNKHIKDHFEAQRESWRPPPLRYTLVGQAADGLLVSPLRRWLTGRSWSDITDPSTVYQGKQRDFTRTSHHVLRPVQVAPGYAGDLAQLGATCRALRIRCLFLTQSHAYRPETLAALRERIWMNPPFADYALDLQSMAHIASLYNDHLVRFAGQAGHGLCDVAAAVPPSAELFLDEIHITDAGARMLATLLLTCVRQMRQGTGP